MKESLIDRLKERMNERTIERANQRKNERMKELLLSHGDIPMIAQIGTMAVIFII